MAGIHVARTRIVGFATSAFFAGVAGGLLAHLLRILTPSQFSFNAVFLGLAMMILGGMGSITGSVVGAAVMTIVPQYVIPLEGGGRVLGLDLPPLPGLTQVVIAIILVAVMLVRPHGITGRWELTSQAAARGLSSVLRRRGST
jgi:branched-chain amino acid transport system permease protein